MKTWDAGALFTERSKRGSSGWPATLGISMRNGGSRASLTAAGAASGLRSESALSSSPVMCSPTLVGGRGGAAQAASSARAMMDRMDRIGIMSSPVPCARGPLSRAGEERESLLAARPADDHFAFGNAHDLAVAEAAAYRDF